MSWQEYISKNGYRDDSPVKYDENGQVRKSITINTPNGMIDMSNVGMPLLANGRVLPPYSGLHQFDTNVVRETPIDTYGYLGLNREENAVGAGFGANLPSGWGAQVSGNTPTRPNPYYKGGVGLGLNKQVGPWGFSGRVERNIKSGEITPRFGAKYNFEEGGAVHAKAKILMDEGYDRDQAYAIAYSMQERGELPKAQDGNSDAKAIIDAKHYVETSASPDPRTLAPGVSSMASRTIDSRTSDGDDFVKNFNWAQSAGNKEYMIPRTPIGKLFNRYGIRPANVNSKRDRRVISKGSRLTGAHGSVEDLLATGEYTLGPDGQLLSTPKVTSGWSHSNLDGSNESINEVFGEFWAPNEANDWQGSFSTAMNRDGNRTYPTDPGTYWDNIGQYSSGTDALYSNPDIGGSFLPPVTIPSNKYGGSLPKAQDGNFNGNSYLYPDSLHNYNESMKLIAEAERLGLVKQEGKIGTGFEEKDRQQKAYFDRSKSYGKSGNIDAIGAYTKFRPSVEAIDYSIYATPDSYMETMGNMFNTLTGGLAGTGTKTRRWYIPEYDMPKGTRSISKMPFQPEPEPRTVMIDGIPHGIDYGFGVGVATPKGHVGEGFEYVPLLNTINQLDPKIWKQDEPGNVESIYHRIPEEVEETVTESIPTVDKKKEEKIKDSIQIVNPYGDQLFYIKYDSIGNSRHIPKHEYDLEVKKGELNVLESKQYGGSLPIAQTGIPNSPYEYGWDDPVYSASPDQETGAGKQLLTGAAELSGIPMAIRTGERIINDPKKLGKNIAYTLADISALQQFPWMNVNPVTGEESFSEENLSPTLDATVLAPYLGSGARTLKGGLKGLYNTVATGNSAIPIAWKSGLGTKGTQGFKAFDELAGANLSAADAKIVADYMLTPNNFLAGSKGRIALEKIIKNNPSITKGINSPISRIEGYSGGRESISTKYGSQPIKYDRDRSWTVGDLSRPHGSKNYYQRIVIPQKYAKNMGDKFFKIPYKESKNLRSSINANEQQVSKLYAEKELLGNPNLKVIGKSKDGYYENIIVKPTRVTKYQQGGPLPIAQGGVELQDSTSAQRVKVRLDKAYKAAMDKYRLTNKPIEVVEETIAPVTPVVAPKPKRPAPKVVPPVQEMDIQNLLPPLVEPQASAYEPVWPKAEGIVGPTGPTGAPETIGVTGIEGPRYITDIPKQPVEESIMDKIYDGLEALGNVEGVQDLIDLGKMVMEREGMITPKSKESTLQVDIPVQKDLSSEVTNPPVDADDAFLKTFRLASIQDKDITPIEGDGSGFIINFKPNTKVVFTPPASKAYEKGKNIENIRAMFFSNHAGKGTSMPSFGNSNEKKGEQSSSLNIIMGYNPKTQKMVFFNRAKKPKDYKDLNIPTQGGITWEELKKSISKNNNGEEIIETTEYPGYVNSTKIGGDLGMFAGDNGNRSRKLSELTKTGTQDGGKTMIVYKKDGRIQPAIGFWGGAKNLVDISRKLEKSGATDITYITGDAGSFNMAYVHPDGTYTPEEQRQVKNLNFLYPGAGSYLAIEPEYAKEAVGSYTKGGVERDTSFVIPPGVPHTFQKKRYGGELSKAQDGTETERRNNFFADSADYNNYMTNYGEWDSEVTGDDVTLKMTPGDRTSPIYSDYGHTLVPQTEEGDPYVDLPEVVIEGLSPETEAFFDNPPSWYKYSEEFLDKKKKFLEQLDERKFYLNKDWMDLFGRGEREVINWEELNRIADKYRPDSPIGLPENYMTLGQDEDKYTNTMILQAWLQREKISKPFNQAYNEHVSKKLMEDNPRGNRDLDVWYNSFSSEQKPFLNSVGIGEEYGQNKWTEEGWSTAMNDRPDTPSTWTSTQPEATIVDAAKTMLGYAGDALWTPSDLIGSAIDPQQSWYEGFATNTGRFSSDPQKHAAAQLTTQIVTDPLMWVGLGATGYAMRAAKATSSSIIKGGKLTKQLFKGVPSQTRRLARNIANYKTTKNIGPVKYRTPLLPTPNEAKMIKQIRWIGKGIKENETILTSPAESLKLSYTEQQILEASEKALKFLEKVNKMGSSLSDADFVKLTNFSKKDIPSKIEQMLQNSKPKKIIKKKIRRGSGQGNVYDHLSDDARTELRSILVNNEAEFQTILGKTPAEMVEHLRYYRSEIESGRSGGGLTPAQLGEMESKVDRIENLIHVEIPRTRNVINIERAARETPSPGRDFDVDQFNALSDPTDMQIVDRLEELNPAEREALLAEYPHIAENARQVDELIAAHMAELRSTPSSRGRYATDDEMYAAMEGEGIRPEAFGSYGINPTDPSYLAARIGGLDEVARIRSVHGESVRRAAEASRRQTPSNAPTPENLPQTERTRARNTAEQQRSRQEGIGEGQLTQEEQVQAAADRTMREERLANEEAIRETEA